MLKLPEVIKGKIRSIILKKIKEIEIMIQVLQESILIKSEELKEFLNKDETKSKKLKKQIDILTNTLSYLKDSFRELDKYRGVKTSSHIPESPTYWTCFSYEVFPPHELHCTHKFLGEQSEENAKKILAILDSYFSKNSFVSFKPHFNTSVFFGKNKDVKVLKLDKFDKDLFLPELRKMLNAFRKDDYAEYSPHVTTLKDSINLPFKNYCFMFGDKIIKKY